VVREYEAYLAGRRHAPGPGDSEAEKTATAEPVRMVSVRILERPEERPVWKTGEAVRIGVSFVADAADRPVHVGVLLESAEGTIVASLGSNQPGAPPFVGRTRYDAVLAIPGLPLVKGTYNLTFLLMDERGLHVYDRRYLRQAIVVESGHFDSGFVYIPYRWELG